MFHGFGFGFRLGGSAVCGNRSSDPLFHGCLGVVALLSAGRLDAIALDQPVANADRPMCKGSDFRIVRHENDGDPFRIESLKHP
jgi:hypothetical protein